MATLKPLSIPTKYLTASITSSASSLQLSDILDWNGTALTSASFGTLGYIVLRNANNTVVEFMEIDVTTIASSSITILRRGLGFDGDYVTEISANKKSWVKGTHVELGSHVPQLLKHFVTDIGDQTIAGIKTFSSLPTIPATPSASTDAASKGYVDGVAVAGAPNANTTTKGIVEMATQAEIDARTATGGTGAALVGSPDTNRTVLMHDSATSSTGNDSYAITLTPSVTAYSTGQIFIFRADVANTGACSLNVNALGAISLKVHGSDPRNNYILANATVICRYDSTGPVMNILSVSSQPSVSVDGAEIYGASSGGTDAYAITVPYISAYTVGQVFRLKTDVANTGSATLNVNSIGALNILHTNGSALATGDIATNEIIEVVVYDGSNVRILSRTSSTPIGRFSCGTTSKNASDASTTQTIAHGLGATPKYVRIRAISDTTVSFGSAAFPLEANTTYNGTTQQSISTWNVGAPAYATTASFELTTASSANSNKSTGVLSVDSTNISIAWTKTGSPTGTYTMLWEAMT